MNAAKEKSLDSAIKWLKTLRMPNTKHTFVNYFVAKEPAHKLFRKADWWVENDKKEHRICAVVCVCVRGTTRVCALVCVNNWHSKTLAHQIQWDFHISTRALRIIWYYTHKMLDKNRTSWRGGTELEGAAARGIASTSIKKESATPSIVVFIS